MQEWTQLIKRLRAAVDAHHDNPTELIDRMHMLGAWAIALRVFHPAVLRNTGGGGKEGARRVRAALRLWHDGRYDLCYDRPLRERVLQKAFWCPPAVKPVPPCNQEAATTFSAGRSGSLAGTPGSVAGSLGSLPAAAGKLRQAAGSWRQAAGTSCYESWYGSCL